jgi:hypothetical protein
MYHAIGMASEDETIANALAKVDTFIALAPCIYTGTQPSSGQGALRTLTKNAIKDMQATDYDYLFGG